MTTTRPRRSQIILFSHPRTACHLLERMLASKQPDLSILFHPCAPARPLQVQLYQSEPPFPLHLQKDFINKINEGIAQWHASLPKAKEDGNILFVHEHHHFTIIPEKMVDFLVGKRVEGNFTLFPEDLLLREGTVPFFTTRHPALTVPALYKAMQRFEGSSVPLSGLRINSTQTWTIALYNYYVTHGITPVIVETDDFIESRELVRVLAERVGLDREGCVFEWQRKEGELEGIYELLQESLMRSEGVDRSKAKFGVRIEEEEGKWNEEFGEEGARVIRNVARGEMEGYEWLRGRKLKVPAE